MIDGISASAVSTIALHTQSSAHSPGSVPCCWAHCITKTHSPAPLSADVSKNPILLFHCVSGDRGPSLRAQGHRTHQHKESYLSLSLCMPVFLSYTHTHLLYSATLAYSFSLQAVSTHLLECPALKYAEIATIASLTAKISSLSIWTQ